MSRFALAAAIAALAIATTRPAQAQQAPPTAQPPQDKKTPQPGSAKAPTRSTEGAASPTRRPPPKPQNPRPSPPQSVADAAHTPARAHRLGVSLTFGVGSVAMSSFGKLMDDVVKQVKANPNVTLTEDIGSDVQIAAEIGFRYYFPLHIFAHVGFAAMYNRSSAAFTIGPVSGDAVYHNLVLEVPIMIGGYFTVADRLYVHVGVGPDVFFFARSFWDIEGQFIQGGLPDFKASGGVGFVAAAGADYMVSNTFSVGIELRGRYLETGDLAEKNSGITWNGFSRTGPYQLDFSGITASLVLRVYPM